MPESVVGWGVMPRSDLGPAMNPFCGLLLRVVDVGGLGGYRYVTRHGVPVVTAAADGRQTRAANELPNPADWPWWRGPLGTGISRTARPPQRWSGSEGVRWKVAVPGSGHASPIVCGDRVILATADEAEQSVSLLCYCRRDGSPLWT